MKRSGVRLSVCPIDRQQQQQLAGLLLSIKQVGDIDGQPQPCCRWCSAGASTEQQM